MQGASEVPRGTALFETLVMFENRDLNRVLAAADPRWAGRRATLHEQPSPPLTLTVFDDAALEARLLFDRRRYREAVVERIAGYFATAIDELSRGAERLLGAVDVLPPAERRLQLHGWNATRRPFTPELLHAGFEERARQQPQAVAAEAEGGALTYAALDERANRLAHELVARGAGPGIFVGVCLGRGLDLVVALLAVAKAGAAYVPLDPAYPAERVAFMLADAGAPLVVTEQRHDALFAGLTGACARLVVDGADAASIARMPATAPPPRAATSDACYAIYTSGSTGRPKGVVLTHAAVTNTIDWVSRTFGLGPGDRLLFVTSPCFDLSVYDTFGALAAGATVVVASRELLMDPEALAAAIVAKGITIWDSAPAALQRLAPFFPQPARGAALRVVMLSGDWIPLSLPEAVRAAFPGVRVVSLGGATEAAIWSNWFPIGSLESRWTSIPYGRPIQNARYHVLDARMRPVPIGATGDLYIGGACLAEGYLHRPELTAERFVPDPFSDDPGARLYKTGDLARYFDDGELEFLGRADFQVKIRGYRVELGEVEATLAQLEGVRDAVCAAVQDASGQKSLVGYVVGHEGASLDPEAIKRQLGARLAGLHGSVARGRARRRSRSRRTARWTARRSPTRARAPRRPAWSRRGRTSSARWRRSRRSLLGRSERAPIGVHDDFFALGGHSLLAVMLVSRIERELGVRVRLSSVLQNPTVGTLSAAVQGAVAPAHPSQRGPHVVTLKTHGDRSPLFLVSGAGGFGFGFQGIARSLGDRHPVHVLHAIGAEDEREGVERTIEEAADVYVPQILAAAPAGGVVLGGYSFGVLVAFEIARKLAKAGREVPLLVSFDGFAPGFPKLMPLPRRALAHARELFFGDTKAYARDRIANLRGRVLEKLGRGEDRLPAIADADEATDRRLRRLEAALWRARGAYRPEGAWKGELLLLKSALSQRWLGNAMDDPLYGWTAYIEGRIHVTTVAGDHHGVFEEANHRLMAEAILAATERTGGGPV